MAWKRHSDEDVLKLLREIELKLSAGTDVASACRGVAISDATYYNWRKRFGGIDLSLEAPSIITRICGFGFHIRVVGLGKRDGRGALKLLKRPARFCGRFVSKR